MNTAAPGVEQMKPALRHTVQIVLRLALALCVAIAMPLAHVEWGESYPGEGQKAFGMLLVFYLIGMGTAFVYFIVGTVVQIFLRRRPLKASLTVDICLAILLGLALAYGGVTAHYVG